jgi:hypothetical protein
VVLVVVIRLREVQQALTLAVAVVLVAVGQVVVKLAAQVDQVLSLSNGKT